MIDASPLLLVTDDYVAYKRPKQIQKDAERRARFLARKDAETAAAKAKAEAEALVPAYDNDADDDNAPIFNDGLGLDEEDLYNLLDSDSDIRNQIAGPASGSAAAAAGTKRHRSSNGKRGSKGRRKFSHD